MLVQLTDCYFDAISEELDTIIESKTIPPYINVITNE